MRTGIATPATGNGACTGCRRAIEIVRGLDDHTVTRFLAFVGWELARRADGSAVLAGVPREVRSGEHYKEIATLAAPRRAERVGRRHSAEVARVLLEYMATQEALAKVIEEVWASFRRDELAADPSLELGIAGSLVTFAASDGFGGLARAGGGISLSPDLAEALSEAVLDERATASLSGRGVDGDRLHLTAYHPSCMRPCEGDDVLVYDLL